MTTPESAAAAAPGPIEFSTTDQERAIAYLSSTYGPSLRVSGARGGHLFRHSRADGGSFAIDDVRLPLHLNVRQAPLGSHSALTVTVADLEGLVARLDRPA
jgi:hypothetical protein